MVKIELPKNLSEQKSKKHEDKIIKREIEVIKHESNETMEKKIGTRKIVKVMVAKLTKSRVRFI